MIIFTTIRLLGVSIVLKVVASLVGLPSNDIDTFIRLFSLRSIKKLGLARALQLFINPISSIRYFEFNFVRKSLANFRIKNILDVSSPRAFGFFYAAHHPEISYTMINPDPLDRKETQIQLAAVDIPNFHLAGGNAVRLPYKTKSFDVVISISVIEHIVGRGDTQAIEEMWRVLKPFGRLILTTHVIAKHRDEYRSRDQYNLQRHKKKYFFQRMYDMKSLDKRIISVTKVKPSMIEIIGERENNWFDGYIQRWIKKELKETVWDPWYIMTKFKEYDSIKSLPGIGVIGLVFEKK